MSFGRSEFAPCLYQSVPCLWCTFLSLVTLSLQTFDFRSRCNILCFQWVCLCTSVVSTLAPAWHVQYLVAFVLNRCCTLWLWHVFVCGCSSAFAGSCVVAHAVLCPCLRYVLTYLLLLRGTCSAWWVHPAVHGPTGWSSPSLHISTPPKPPVPPKLNPKVWKFA